MEAIFANPQRRVGIADTTPAFQYSSPKGGIADYSGSNGLLSPSNLSPYFDAIAGALQTHDVEPHPSDIRFPASRMVERNQVWAASVFILGCQDIRYLNVPRTAGAFRIFMAGFDASSSAMRLGTVATRFVLIRLRIAVM